MGLLNRNVKGLLLAAVCIGLLLFSIHSARASHWSGWWGWVEHDFSGYDGKPIMDIWGPFASEGACLDMLEDFVAYSRTVEDYDCKWTENMGY